MHCRRLSRQVEDTEPVLLNVLQSVMTIYPENRSGASGRNSPMCLSVSDGRLNVGVPEDVLGTVDKVEDDSEAVILPCPQCSVLFPLEPFSMQNCIHAHGIMYISVRTCTLDVHINLIDLCIHTIVIISSLD